MAVKVKEENMVHTVQHTGHERVNKVIELHYLKSGVNQ